MIYCYNDREQAGAEVAAYIKKNNGSSQVITHPAQVEGGEDVKAFCYLPISREAAYVLELAETIHKEHPEIEIVPDLKVMRLQKRLINQAMTFGQWMPSGWLVRSMAELQKIINEMPYPVNSLSNSGDRRLMLNPSDIYVEALECFKGEGIALSNELRQKKYAYYQVELLERAPSWRVFLFAMKYAVMVNFGNGPDFKVYPIDVLSDQLLELLRYVYAFMLDNQYQWGSVEIACGSDPVRSIRSPFVGSISTNWPKDWFLNGGMIFETKDGMNWESTGIPAVRWYSVVAKELVNG